MTLAPPSPGPALQPLQLPWDLRLNADQFERVCQANPEAVLELSADGQLIAMTATDSSTGFRLPDGSVLSPDASLVRMDRWQALSPEQRRGFAPLCPELVVELVSGSDEGSRGVSALREKLETYRANGAQLGWLLLLEIRAVEIWRAGATSSERQGDAATLECNLR